jgi:hypothetical protein
MNEIPLVAAQVTARHTPAVVRFTDPQEFCAELRRDQAAIQRGLVRLTCERASAAPEPFTELSLIAGYLVDTGAGALQLIELRRLCGPLWGLDGDRAVLELAERSRATVERALADAGLECRPGRFLPAAEPTVPGRRQGRDLSRAERGRAAVEVGSAEEELRAAVIDTMINVALYGQQHSALDRFELLDAVGIGLELGDPDVRGDGERT